MAPVAHAAPAVAPVAHATPAVAPAAYHQGSVIAPQVQYSYLPYAQNYGYHHEATAPTVHSVKAAPSRPVASITPAYYGAAQTYAAAPVVPATYAATPVPVSAPAPVHVQHVVAPTPTVHAAQGSQYHAQDDFGQYNYGYNDGSSVKQEIKTADGVIRGSYSYIDADGLVQSVNYIADALGFRVGATNLPVHNVDTPVEAAAPVEPAAYVQPVAPAAPVPVPVISPEVNYAYLPYATNYGYSQPIAYAQKPVESVNVDNLIDLRTNDEKPTEYVQAVVAPAPVAVQPGTIDPAPSSQFHAQDDIGQYNYGYTDGNSIKQEVKTADGVTRGSYSYVDANGLVQTVNYISDAMGFRVAATNLPVHDVEHNGVDAVVEAQVPYTYLPYAQSYGYNLPIAAAAA